MNKDIIKLDGKLEKRISEQSGNEYTVLILNITDDYTKDVILSRAEAQLLKLSEKSSINDMPSFL